MADSIPATDSQSGAENSTPPVHSTPSFPTPDPYQIHPSENPTAVFFSPLLDGDNYATWSIGITKALNAKGKLGFIDGTFPPPTDPATHSNWKRCDDLVSSWIINSVSKGLQSGCLFDKTAFDVWKGLKLRFGQSNAPRIFHLRSSIARISQGDLDVIGYYTKLKSLWDELAAIHPHEPCICGFNKAALERAEKDRAIEFLQGLHERFSPLRSNILIMEPFPTTEKIFGLVKQEEQQQNLNHAVLPQVESAALQFHSKNRSAPSSFSPRNNDSNRVSDNNKNKRPRDRPLCDYCHKHGHFRATCWILHGKPPSASAASTSTTAAAITTTSPSVFQQLLTSLSADQKQQLMTALEQPATSNEEADPNPRINSLSGPTHESGDW